jgi:lysophospholipase L1-like esterase
MSLRLVIFFIFKFFLVFNSSAVIAQLNLNFNNTEVAPEPFICPGQKSIKAKASPPNNEEELSLPSLDLLSTALANYPHQTIETTIQSSSLLLPKNLKQPIKIGIWGDSHLAANFFSEELIKSIGLAKEDVLPSFFAANIGRAGVRLPLRKSCLGGGWKFSYAYNSNPQTSNNPIMPNGFPIGMIRMQTKNQNSYLWLDFRTQALSVPSMQSFEILLDQVETDEQTVLGITLDEGVNESRVEVGRQSKLSISADFPFSTVKIRLIRGSLSLDGFIPHYLKTPKINIDNLAIPGSTAKSWTNLAQANREIPPYDLAILAYGTNEGNNSKFDSTTYQTDLKQGLSNFRRIYPSTACVLIGPTDRGILVPSNKHLKKGVKPKLVPDLLKYSKVHATISSIQEQEASIAGCSFWDWQKAMGGMGSAYTWAYEKPPLMSKDLIHLTIPGYQRSARQFSNDFLLKTLINP